MVLFIVDAGMEKSHNVIFFNSINFKGQFLPSDLF